MNVILPIAIYAAIGLAGLGILGMGISGLRSLAYGKARPLGIAIVVVPIILVLVFSFTMETWAQAAIFTLVVMFGLTLVAMFLTGVRNLFR